MLAKRWCIVTLLFCFVARGTGLDVSVACQAPVAGAAFCTAAALHYAGSPDRYSLFLGRYLPFEGNGATSQAVCLRPREAAEVRDDRYLSDNSTLSCLSRPRG